ncbi:MAG: hypothetical protein J5950_09775, partial [Clostridia bacterium]|nr:hypothetical protein [Clostridia bacterium]
AAGPVADKVSLILDNIAHDHAGISVSACGDALLNKGICDILFTEERVNVGRESCVFYPDPAAVARLGAETFIDAADKTVFAPEKLSLNYMKEW